jgi:hypothetical protein
MPVALSDLEKEALTGMNLPVAMIPDDLAVWENLSNF